MGGLGSGNWCRWDKKTTTDEVKRIDIRFMKKKGALKQNTTGTMHWSARGQPSGSIRYTCYADYLCIDFKYRTRSDEWQSVLQRILFDRTSCHFGGERLWFLCPSCSKRVGVLYGVYKLFSCRHCYQLPYSSQNSGYIDNLIEQKDKLGERIFRHYECGEGWGKKKGMHWKTFKRLHNRYVDYEKRWRKECNRRCFDVTELGIY